MSASRGFCTLLVLTLKNGLEALDEPGVNGLVVRHLNLGNGHLTRWLILNMLPMRLVLKAACGHAPLFHGLSRGLLRVRCRRTALRLLSLSLNVVRERVRHLRLISRVRCQRVAFRRSLIAIAHASTFEMMRVIYVAAGCAPDS